MSSLYSSVTSIVPELVQLHKLWDDASARFPQSIIDIENVSD